MHWNAPHAQRTHELDFKKWNAENDAQTKKGQKAKGITGAYLIREESEIADRVPTSGNAPRDRSRTTVGRVWMCTMDNHRVGPTVRRPARFLGLGAAPKSMPDRHRKTGW